MFFIYKQCFQSFIMVDSSFLYLDMDLIAQHGSSEDHGFGSSLELFTHMERLLKRGAPLVHIPCIQNLGAAVSIYSNVKPAMVL